MIIIRVCACFLYFSDNLLYFLIYKKGSILINIDFYLVFPIKCFKGFEIFLNKNIFYFAYFFVIKFNIILKIKKVNFYYIKT